MEEAGGLQSMGLQTVRHDWATSLTHSMSFFQDPIQDTTLHLVFTFSQASLGCTNVSQTFPWFWWPWQFWGILVKYFVKYPWTRINHVFLTTRLGLCIFEKKTTIGTYYHCWSIILDVDLDQPAEILIVDCSGTPLQYSCLENPMDGGAW